MGKTKRRSDRYDDDEFFKAGKPKKSKKQKQQFREMLNNYVEDFDDEFELDDIIEIRHNKHTP